ncbi:MAG: hypothetical protein JWM21_1251 [Acidobacteria bacterium]|nr:hypothetical protein [Acidobacteriota bacterium]
MASRNAFTEEGRTRFRNFQRRIWTYLLLWAVVGLALTAGGIYLKTRYGYRPLQRLYLRQYLKASIKSLLPLQKPSKYTLLVRVISNPATSKEQVLGCTDDQVTPVRDESGRVKFDPQLGPFFNLHEGIPHTFFYWRAVWQMDKQMYPWLKQEIYGGRSLAGLYWICFLPLPLIVAVGMLVSIKMDLRMNSEYEAGDLLRGVRALTPKEYAREIGAQESGIGLPAFIPRRVES